MTPSRRFILALEQEHGGETWSGDDVTCTNFDGSGYAECYPVWKLDDAVSMRLVQVSPTRRGQGVGNNVVRTLTDLADKFGVTMYTSVHSLDATAMNNDQLTAWYGRHGFLPSAENPVILVRPPRGT